MDMKKVASKEKTATFIDFGVYEFYGGNFWGYEI